MYKTHTGKCFTIFPNHNCTMTFFADDFLSNQRSHVRSRISRIFSRVVFFWRGKWVFRSFSLCSCGVGYRQSRMTLNGNSKGRDTKNGFSFADSHLSCRKFIWSEDFPLIENYSVFLRSFPFSLPFTSSFPVFGKSSFSILFALP